MPALFDKLFVVVRRDFLTALRYRAGFWAQILIVLAELAGFFFLSRAVGPGFRPDGVDYYSFLLIGTAVQGFLMGAVGGFVNAVQEAQLTGTMEVLMTTSTPAPVVVLLMACSDFMRNFAQMALYFVVGAVVFGVPLHANISATVVILLLSCVVAMALGIMGAALQVAVQKGGVVTWAFGICSGVFAGVMFPVSVLPPVLRSFSALIPFTHALNGLRQTLLRGAPLSEVARPVGILFAFALLLLPVSVVLFAKVLRNARLQGTLSYY